MKRKTKTFYFVTVSVIAGVAAVALYYWWTAPYSLPKVEDGITLDQYGLTFEGEQEAQLAIEALPASDQIAELKEKMEKAPDNLAYSNALRIQMREAGMTEDYISYVQQLKPATPELQLQQALAYVDLLQDPDLGTASLGQISMRSISLLNEIINERPYDWFAHYARGLNNLYWPSGLQRTDKAIQDLGYCLAVAKQLEGQLDLAIWPLTYIAYGDALVKDGQVKKGIEVWKDGFRKYKTDDALSRRAGLSEQGARDTVRGERGIDEFRRPDPSVSDLSMVWDDMNRGE
ncbi:hypothetical protein DFQ01_107132 [Paenibacillus cellulosilyticus]|uniref:Tetratricopeptide repeat protein n=1 Tax=Paenibacillus cellulosilyticus TaxID=375489 RepID=A0A2V2YVJ2_9BACL|nr:hypothetical protein [Paenibacillus cellulosilyticus]PWW03235.1 hypothetical protein DFQ01_107132 [Paenibacillus cellulosilyticus]QKS43723.1 hypothetical protein HUB94_04190 [Paenibacillus cellulosilyticus]